MIMIMIMMRNLFKIYQNKGNLEKKEFRKKN